MNNIDEENLTNEFIHKIYHDLAEAMLSALEKGKMLAEESRYSSQYIIEKMEVIRKKSELVLFLEDLSSRWPAYYDVFVRTKNEIGDTQKIQNVESQLDQLTTQ